MALSSKTPTPPGSWPNWGSDLITKNSERKRGAQLKSWGREAHFYTCSGSHRGPTISAGQSSLYDRGLSEAVGISPGGGELTGGWAGNEALHTVHEHKHSLWEKAPGRKRSKSAIDFCSSLGFLPRFPGFWGSSVTVPNKIIPSFREHETQFSLFIYLWPLATVWKWAITLPKCFNPFCIYHLPGKMKTPARKQSLS